MQIQERERRPRKPNGGGDAEGTSLDQRKLLRALQAVRDGDFSVRLASDHTGLAGKVADTFNEIVTSNQRLARELERAGKIVGKDGQTRHRMASERRSGAWGAMESSVNTLIDDLLWPTTEVTRTISAVAKGDLQQTMSLEVDGRPLKGEFLRSATIVNSVIEQMSAFTSEVTRVARGVGSEGKLGGQAVVPGVAGTWKDLTDSVNSMASNLTGQVRNISEVTIAVANGDLSRKITVDVRGEILQLKETVNTMVDQLNSFAAEVTRVAREVGTEGKLGGQAHVPGAAGTWKDLTANTNLLAANLTNQVRAIAEVATAVTKGDLTRSIQVEARGEVSELKDNINAMIGNLRVTTERNTEQDWLKTNLAKFSRMMQGQRDLVTVGKLLLSELAPLVNAQQGIIYVMERAEPVPCLKELASYADEAYESREPRRYAIGEGLVGQAAVDRQRLLLTDIPGDSIRVQGGLLSARPRSVVVLPVLYEGQVKAVVELASLGEFTASQLTFLEQLTGSIIGVVLNTIEATMRTEGLLKQSQQLAGELQTQQTELQQTNEELANKVKLLALANDKLAAANLTLQAEKTRELEVLNATLQRANAELERANRSLHSEVAERSRAERALQEADRNKDEFLAMLAHELRNPLAPILNAVRLMRMRPAEEQFKWSQDVIQRQVTHLTRLVDELLDVSRITRGKITLSREPIEVATLITRAIETVQPLMQERGHEFTVDIPNAPLSVDGDPVRLTQALANVLGNAAKYTARGGRIGLGCGQNGADVEIRVRDNGIGIPAELLPRIFDLFSQLDHRSPDHHVSGLGIGLALVRRLVQMHGGRVSARSEGAGLGSEFTISLPALIGEAPKSEQQPVPAGEDTPAIPRRILVADDNEDALESLAALLKLCGHEVFSAANGLLALESAERHLPDVALLDIGMPVLDGYEVARRIRAREWGKSVTLIALTGWGQEADRRRSQEAGFDSHLVKPLDLDRLIRLLGQLPAQEQLSRRDEARFSPSAADIAKA